MKNIFTSTLTAALWMLLVASIQAKPTKTVNIKLTFQEAQIMRQLMQQIELGTQEVAPYLEIYTPLEQLTDSVQEPETAREVLLKLPERAPENLLLFMQRATILGVGAKQIDLILSKVQKSLPKDATQPDTPQVTPKKITLQLTGPEAQLTQQMLAQVELSIAEVAPFLAIYTPLEQANNTAQDPTQAVTLKLPETAPQNLLLFIQRTTIVGHQAKHAHALIDKLQHAITFVESPNKP